MVFVDGDGRGLKGIDMEGANEDDIFLANVALPRFAHSVAGPVCFGFPPDPDLIDLKSTFVTSHDTAACRKNARTSAGDLHARTNMGRRGWCGTWREDAAVSV